MNQDSVNEESGQAEFIAHILDLHEDNVLAIVQDRLTTGDDPLAIVEDCQEGMRRVGERYEQGQYFLSALIMAGEILREVTEIVQPIIKKRVKGKESGRILLGTIQNDIHDIGKNIQGILLSCYGFTVYDLGVDVPPSVFLARALKVIPDIVGLSGLLTSSYDTMRETVSLFREASDPNIARAPILIGGGMLTDQVCQYTGADHWATNSMDGVRLCQHIIKSPNIS
jgi:methanogenic corrinoid protein MtbC1